MAIVQEYEIVSEEEFVNSCNDNITYTHLDLFQIVNISGNLSYVNTSINVDFRNNGYINAAFAILFFLAGLPWNALVIGIILWKKLFKSPTYMLMLNLAISNFLVCVLVLPFTMISGIGSEDVFGDYQTVVCQSAVFLLLFPSVSIHTVALLSIDRLIYLKRPLRYKSLVTPSKMFIAIIAVWVFCITISAPTLGTGGLGYVIELHACLYFFSSNTAFVFPFTIEYGLVVALQCMMCTWITCIARKVLKRRFRHSMSYIATTNPLAPKQHGKLRRTSTQDVIKEYNKGQLHLVKIFIAICSASIVTILLSACLTVLVPVCEYLPSILYSLAYVTALPRAVIHPILETFLTPEIRSVITCKPTTTVCMKRRACCARKKSDSQVTELTAV